MSFIGTKDFGLETALGNVPGYSSIYKFGRALDCDSGVATDIWDGADGSTSTDIWVPPTAARIHDIASASASDAAAGTGLRTIRITGLTSFSLAEASELLTMNGVANVPTVNAYVIIYRMDGVTFGAGGTNAGIITATAQTDATVTAAIQVSQGQTQMAIFAVPSTQRLMLIWEQVSVLASSPSGAVADLSLMVMENSDQSDAGFITRNIYRVDSVDDYSQEFNPPVSYLGPLIIKMQALATSNNTVISGSFCAFLVDN